MVCVVSFWLRDTRELTVSARRASVESILVSFLNLPGIYHCTPDASVLVLIRLPLG